MPKIRSEKVASYDNGGFTETTEFKVLHQANVTSNHNKFWAAEIQKHPDGRYRIFTHYGRLGISNVYEVRQTMDGKPVTDFDVIKKLFDSLIKKKLRGKSVKDPETGEKVREAYVDVDTVAPTVGSENIRGKTETKKTATVKVTKKDFDTSAYDKTIAKLIDQLIDENVHNITTNTSIKHTVNGYATELGPVTPDHVKKARQPLDELNNLMGKQGRVPPTREVKDLNSAFFSLIPKPFSRKITEADMILDAKALQTEYDLLDQLATGVQMGSAMSGSAAQKANALGTDIEIIKDREELDRIKEYIESSKASNHRSMDVWRYKVRRVFKIRIPEERTRYERYGKKKGNIEEVFHGSANSNLLSILKGGLIIPPVTASHVCGRMFGTGAYFANSSTKSLNYSAGFWGSRRTKYSNIFLLIADLALGRYYEAYSSLPNGTPQGYDSIWAKKGRALYNDELITPKLEQQTLKYLVEMV